MRLRLRPDGRANHPRPTDLRTAAATSRHNRHQPPSQCVSPRNPVVATHENLPSTRRTSFHQLLILGVACDVATKSARRVKVPSRNRRTRSGYHRPGYRLRADHLILLSILLAGTTWSLFNVTKVVLRTIDDNLPSTISTWTANYSQLRCWYASIRSAVPRNATVYINPAIGTYDVQIIEELFASWALPTTTSHSADWTVTTTANGRCGAASLTFHRHA